MEKKEFDGKEYPVTISCPNCPISCYSIKGALKHAEICNKRRNEGYCCLCKENRENRNPEYYNPNEGRYWYLCYNCYYWAKTKSLCL